MKYCVWTFAFESEMAGWIEDARRVVFSKRKLFARPGSCDMRAGEQGLFKPAGHANRSNAKVMFVYYSALWTVTAPIVPTLAVDARIPK